MAWPGLDGARNHRRGCCTALDTAGLAFADPWNTTAVLRAVYRIWRRPDFCSILVALLAIQRPLWFGTSTRPRGSMGNVRVCNHDLRQRARPRAPVADSLSHRVSRFKLRVDLERDADLLSGGGNQHARPNRAGIATGQVARSAAA